MSTTLARAVSVIALIVGPATLVVTDITQWMLQPTGSAPWAAASEFPGAWLVIALLAVLGPAIWIAGLPATVALAHSRGSVTTLLGALLTAAGLAGGVGHLALFFGVYGALARSDAGAHALTKVADAADQDVLATVLLMVFLIGFSIGPIVLTIGLRIAGVVAVWVPIAAVVTAGANLFGGPIAGIVQLVTLVLVWAPLVVAVARPAGRVPSRAAAVG